MNRTQAIARVRGKLRDTGATGTGDGFVNLTDNQIGEELDQAVLDYSKERPRLKVMDVPGAGSPYFLRSLLTSFVDDWSVIRTMEYPAADIGAGGTPTYLDGTDAYEIYQTPADVYVRLYYITPASGQTLRVTYTIPHTLADSGGTIPAPHVDAVCDLGASYCCVRRAAGAAGTTESIIQADTVNYQDGVRRWTKARDNFAAQYRAKIGLPPQSQGSGPVVGYADWDMSASYGLDHLTHGRRRR